MFSVAEVDELFTSTTRALRRSQVLLNERRTTAAASSLLPPTFCPPTSSTAAVGAASSSFSSSSYSPSTSGSFGETVCALRTLSDVRDFVDAAAAMQSKVVAELSTPSPALQARRCKGNDTALLQSVLRGLRGADGAAWRSSEATACLWGAEAVDGEDGEAEASGRGAADADPPGTLQPGHRHASGAGVAATLLFAALCVDVALAVPRAAPAVAADLSRLLHSSQDGTSPAPGSTHHTTSTSSSAADEGCVVRVDEWARDGNARLGALLDEAVQLLPRGVAVSFVSRVADLLLRPLPATHHPTARSGATQIGCGVCLFPALNTYVLERFSTTLAARCFVKPLQDVAHRLRAEYYRSSDAFQAQCRWLLDTTFVLVKGCQAAAAAAAATPSASPSAVRHVRTVQRLYDAWLLPLEKTFGLDSARHGMAARFFDAVVKPHGRLVRLLLLPTQAPKASPASNTAGGRAAAGPAQQDVAAVWASTLHTAQYRLLLVLEKLSQSEAAQANGRSGGAAKQRHYEALLRQNGGKITVALLQSLAEDKQRVLEETPSRSPEGHRLYRLHDGVAQETAGAAARAVFVYVDDGALFMKVGRSRVFQRVTSVEDIFRPLE